MDNGQSEGVSVQELRDTLDDVEPSMPVELVLAGDVGAEDDDWIGWPLRAVTERHGTLYLQAVKG